jgi:putative tryptophan/tyrosine transport system substrate-binding protein
MQSVHLKRRDVIALIGSAAAASGISIPFAASAQPLPVVGFLSGQSPDTYAPFPAAFRKGMGEAGYVEGNNVAIEYRWAHGRPDQLPALAVELVRYPVSVIAATGSVAAALAAKAVTTSIPIVFNSGEDPVRVGLVSSLNRPGGNVTGISWFSVDSAAKRLSLLVEVTPAGALLGLLTSSKDPELPAQLETIKGAAPALGRRLVVVDANTPSEIDAAFATLRANGVRALMIASGPFFINQRAQLVALAAQHALPCIYSDRESVVAGGLMSYGNNLQDAYRRNGLYVSRILKGDKPGDLPIDRATKFELVINLRTAKALALEIPPTVLAVADEVIE